jgi:hypothetical protein
LDGSFLKKIIPKNAAGSENHPSAMVSNHTHSQ